MKNEDFFTPKSALVFYEINCDDLFEYTFDEVFDNFILESKSEKAVCRNVFHFGDSVEHISMLLKYPELIDADLFQEIMDEFFIGSNYVFVHPIYGRPVIGVLLEDLIYTILDINGNFTKEY